MPSLIALAIAIRVAAVWCCKAITVPRSTYEHGEIAANLLAGRGFSIEVPGGRRPDLAAGAGLSGPRRRGLRDRRRRDASGVAAAGAGPVRPGRTPRPGGPAPVPVWSRRAARGMAWTAGLIVALHPTLVYAATHVQVADLGATAARLDPRLGLPDRCDRTDSRRGDHRWAARAAGADRPDPRAGRDRHRLGDLAVGPGRRTRPTSPSRRLIAIVAHRCAWSAIRSVAGAQRPGPRRVRRDQEHVRLCVLAGELRPERGDRQGRAAVGRADPGARSARLPSLERPEPDALGGAARGRLSRRYRPDEGRLPTSSGRSRSRSGRGSCSDGPLADLQADPADMPGSVCAGSATSSSSTRPIPSRGCWPIGCLTSG